MINNFEEFVAVREAIKATLRESDRGHNTKYMDEEYLNLLKDYKLEFDNQKNEC